MPISVCHLFVLFSFFQTSTVAPPHQSIKASKAMGTLASNNHARRVAKTTNTLNVNRCGNSEHVLLRFTHGPNGSGSNQEAPVRREALRNRSASLSFHFSSEQTSFTEKAATESPTSARLIAQIRQSACLLQKSNISARGAFPTGNASEEEIHHSKTAKTTLWCFSCVLLILL